MLFKKYKFLKKINNFFLIKKIIYLLNKKLIYLKILNILKIKSHLFRHIKQQLRYLFFKKTLICKHIYGKKKEGNYY